MAEVDWSGTRLYELMRDGRFMVLTRASMALDEAVAVAVHADASLPEAVLVRPDGYVAWAGSAAELPAALRHWIADNTVVDA